MESNISIKPYTSLHKKIHVSRVGARHCLIDMSVFKKNPYSVHMGFGNVRKNEVKSSCVP